MIRENPNNLIVTTVMMAATTVAARMFRFIHCYGNITIADGRDGAGNSFAPCNALPKGSRPKAAFCVLIKIKKEVKDMTLEALKNAIARLIVARREAHGNEAEEARINAKLDKLYNLKYTMPEQAVKAKSE